MNQHFRGMGPIAYLADLTIRMWCNGSTEKFEFFRIGSSPKILEIRGFKPLCFTLAK